MFRALLNHLPATQFAKIPHDQLRLDALAAVAHDWLANGDAERARKLLEPIFTELDHLDERAEPAFDVLTDCYTALNKPRKKRALVERVSHARSAVLRSAALQRWCTLLADSGDMDEAWRVFQLAQRADPDSSSLGHLEVILLLTSGRRDQAVERARYWLARLRRGNHENLDMLKQEFALLLAAITAVVGFAVEHALVESDAVGVGLAFLVILGVIVATSMRVAHHAEMLAERFGEPYGTMILTSSAVIVEVVMLAILMMNSPQPTLARDTVYAAVMIDIIGIIGIAAIIGGLRHGEQKYNLDASNSYIAMLLVSLGISMFIPDFVPQQSWQMYSVFTIIVMAILYGVFLRIQTVEHRYFFRYQKPGTQAHGDDHDGDAPIFKHVGLLIVSVVLIGVLAEILSVLLEPATHHFNMPAAIPAVMVALISASPEILTAMRAALRDEMQTVINIALGASLSTVLLTVPVIELIALLTGTRIDMGITPVQAAMLLLTLLAAMINLHDGETNVLEGAVLFALFATFVVLTFAVV